MNKHNYFVIFFKKISSFITNLLEKYLNKLNINNLVKKKSNIIVGNRVVLSIVLSVILLISYLSIPHIYNKVEIREELKNQLFNNFSINFVFSKNFNYKIFPRPHFIIENSTILDSQINISEVKKLKIYVSLGNLFSLKKIKINGVILENANFNFYKKNYNFFIKVLDNNFLNSNIIIKDSNIFYYSDDKEVLFINKILKMKFYYDAKDLKNVLFSKNELFNIPFTYELIEDKIKNKLFSKINLKFLRLQIENEHDYSNVIKKGITDLTFNQNKSSINYELDGSLFIFKFFDKLINPNFIYEGKINFNPFYSNFYGKTDRISVSHLFNSNALLIELLKTKIFNNKNLNVDFKVNVNKIQNYQSFVDIFFNSKIQEGLIDIDNTKFKWGNYANFEISDSLIYVSKNQLNLDGKLIINIIKPKEIYQFLFTPKKYRSKIKKIELNINYNFEQNIMNLSNIKFDDQSNEKINYILKSLIFKKNKLQNKIYLKKKNKWSY